MQELWEGDMALTVAKSLPAGLHLYNTLTGETLKIQNSSRGQKQFCKFCNYILVVVLFADDSVSVYSAGIYTNSDLFVWNGREVRKGTVNFHHIFPTMYCTPTKVYR